MQTNLESILDSIVKVEVIAGGNYGCVFLITTDDGTEFADKVEFVSQENPLDTLHENTLVHRIVSQFSEGEQCIFIVKLYSTGVKLGLPTLFYETVGNYVDAAKYSANPKSLRHAGAIIDFCYTLRRTLSVKLRYKKENPFSEGPLVTHSMMQYANGGTLRDFVLGLVQKKLRVTLKTFNQIVFPLVWTFRSLWNGLGFTHGDIRLLNVVLAYVDTPTYVMCEDPSIRLALAISVKKGEFIPHLTDFGQSIITETCVPKAKGIYTPTCDPRNMFVGFPLLSIGAASALQNDLWNDMWSFCLMSLEMVTYPVLKTNVLSLHKNAHTYSVVYYDAFKRLLFHLLYNMEGGYSVPDDLESRTTKLSVISMRATILADSLIGVCLLNLALGNNILPHPNDIEGLNNSSIFTLLHLNAMSLLKMAAIDVEGKKIITPYDKVVEIIRSSMGEDGVDFFRTAFAWNRRKSGFSSWEEILEHKIFIDLAAKHETLKHFMMESKNKMKHHRKLLRSRTSQIHKEFKPRIMTAELSQSLLESFRISGLNSMPLKSFDATQAQTISDHFELLLNFESEKKFAIKIGTIPPETNWRNNETKALLRENSASNDIETGQNHGLDFEMSTERWLIPYN